MSKHRISKLLFAVVISAAFGRAAFGQTAQVTGRISDQGGAVVQSARITVTNEGNGFKRETSSNDEGYFTVPSLLPGTYQISIQKEGFKPILQTGLVLQVEQVARLDFTLQTGTVTDTVEVQSGAVSLDTDTYSINYLLDGTSNTDTALGTPAAILSDRRDSGVQRTDGHLFGGIRFQRQPGQHRQQA